jgi:hypothetical protein
MVIDHPDRTRTREIVHAACDAIRHGSIGGQLPRLAADAGLVDIQVEGYTLRFPYELVREGLSGALARVQQQGRLGAADIAAWWWPLEEAQARGQLLATMQTFLVTGTVPA